MKCCICGRGDAAPYLDGGSWRLLVCQCGMIHTEDFGSQALSYAEDDYFVARNQYVQQWDKFTAIFDELLDKIAGYKTSGMMLDVGAGVGTLVAAAAKRGYTAAGVEVSEWAAAFARDEKGLDVLTGLLEDAAYPDAYFDLVTVNHVLEHVPDPVALIAEIMRILKPGGLLVVGVPNIGSIMAHLKGAKWASLRPAEHLWHFTPQTLKRLLAQGGFHELCFEARENHPAVGWGPKSLIIRLINRVAVLTGRSEAMLLFCAKAAE